MNITRFLAVPCLVGTIIITGCSSMSDSYKNYDPSRRYLRTDAYFSDPIAVPPSLSNNKIEEYYPVPRSSGDITRGDKPSLVPPSNSMGSV